jgi:hypothetical protein
VFRGDPRGRTPKSVREESPSAAGRSPCPWLRGDQASAMETFARGIS